VRNLIGVIVLAAIAVSSQNAFALSKFKTAFYDKYAAKHESKDFQSVVKKASCKACHVGGKKKRDMLNAYATQLEKLIEGDANDRIKNAKKEGGKEAENKELAKVLAELDKAFATVGDMKSPSGPKFAELLKEGQLPVDPKEAEAAYQEKVAKEKAEEEAASK
jgi:hypothetical protein